MSNSPAAILFGTDGQEKGVESNPVRTDTTGTTPQPVSGDLYTGYAPEDSDRPTGETTNVTLDIENHLRTRSQVLTDEGSFREDFTGSSLTTSLTGTLSFTNNSSTVTGSGTKFTEELIPGHYIKPDSASESYYAPVESIESDTSLTLSEPYGGSTTSGSSSGTRWKTTTGTGSISVSSSELVIASGTSSSNKTYVQRDADFCPLILSVYAKISQRIANQNARIGLTDDPDNAQSRVALYFDGTDDRKVKLVTSSSSSANDTEITEVTIPSAGRTSSYHLYELDFSGKTASLSINGEIVAVHRRHLPGPYQPLVVASCIENTGSVGSQTSLYLDDVYLQNLNAVEVGSSLSTDPMSVTIAGSSVPITVSLGTETPVNPSLIYTQKLLNGSSSSLLVNGSVTPVVFEVAADADIDIALNELRFVFCSSSIVFDGTKFGQDSALVNGILVELIVNGGDTATISTIKINENFLEFASTAGINVFTEFSGTNDLITASYSLGGSMRLRAGTSDKVKVTVRDNLTATTFKYLQSTLYGVRV
jgi:hypothetical protein